MISIKQIIHFLHSPVLFLNFATLPTRTFSSFFNTFQNKLIDFALKFGITSLKKDEPSVMLDEILNKISKQIVILIDEFDSPIIDSLNKEKDFQENLKSILSSFYSVIKNRNEKVRFLFITGITKLANLSIFSKMNNLVDISFMPEYSTFTGYTEKELEDNFSSYIDKYLENNTKESKNTFISKVRTYYDGYRFSPFNNVKVYNPLSVGLFFLSSCRYENYWDQTAVPQLAVELATRHHLVSIIEGNEKIKYSDFTTFDISEIANSNISKSKVLALLYYTGYLTINNADEDFIILNFPNQEVSSSFSQALVSYYTQDGASEALY